MASIETVPVDERTVVVELSGELDLWSAPHLKRTMCQLLDGGKHRLVLDLAEVRFMDSTALGVLVGIDRRLAGDERLALAKAGREVLRVLEMSGLAAGFRIFPTREAALSHLTLDHAEERESSVLPLTADAALLLGIASTAMPFAQSPAEQAERWLRALRRHGESGAVLASLGVTEAPVTQLEEGGGSDAFGADDVDAVDIVAEHAGVLAAGRGAAKLATTDLLLAVMHVYGEKFDRVLEAHGVQRDELAARLERTDYAEAETAL